MILQKNRFGIIKHWLDDGLLIIEELALKIIRHCTIATAIEFRSKLGFNEHDIILTKEQSVLKLMMNVYEGKNMQNQYNAIKSIFIFMTINLQ